MLNTPYLFLAQNPPAAPQGDPMGTFVMFGAIMVIMWVLMIRPQQKRQKELMAKIAALKSGDRIVTTGGIHGTVSGIKEGPTLVLNAGDGVKLTVDKSAVAVVLPKQEA